MLEKKNIFITGSAKRLGNKLAKIFAIKNNNLALHFHSSEEDAIALKNELTSFNIKCKIYQYDLIDTQNIEGLLCNIIADYGSIDVLINNAAIFNPDNFENLDYNNFMSTLSVNALAPIFLTQFLYKHNPQKSLIINILDYAYDKNPIDFVSYNLSKKLLAQATTMMARFYADKLRINAIAPASVVRGERESEKFFENYYKKSPLQNKATTEQIVTAIEMFYNCEAITGEILTIDGGLNLNDCEY